MKITICALLLSLASASACAAGYAVPSDSVAQRAHPRSPYHMRENGNRHLNISLTGIEQESMELVLIGTIDVNMAQKTISFVVRNGFLLIWLRQIRNT